MSINKLYIKFNIDEPVRIINGCSKDEVGIVESVTYDKDGLKYDIRNSNKLCCDVAEEDISNIY